MAAPGLESSLFGSRTQVLNHCAVLLTNKSYRDLEKGTLIPERKAGEKGIIKNFKEEGTFRNLW